jgi:4-hydroxy-tetrahydrodipicolinate synthase
MTDQRLFGIVPPIVLPMNEAGELDSGSLERHVSHLVDAGVHGLWVNGSTGEFHALDADQRASAVRQVRKAASGAVPVVAHVGDTSTTLTIANARAAVKAGADHISVVAPYWTDFSQAELLGHYRKTAAAIGAPVFAYHLPKLSKIGLTVESIVELASEGTVVGVKDSSSDMGWFRRLLRRTRELRLPLRSFTGGGSMTDLGLFLGADGAMPAIANLTPKHLVGKYDAARAGDWARVRTGQEQLEVLIEAMQLPRRAGSLSAVVATYKYVLAATGRIDGAYAAEPLLPLSEDERERLDGLAVPLIHQLERGSGDDATAQIDSTT